MNKYEQKIAHGYFYNTKTFQNYLPNKLAQGVAHLICVRKVPNSKFGWKGIIFQFGGWTRGNTVGNKSVMKCYKGQIIVNIKRALINIFIMSFFVIMSN